MPDAIPAIPSPQGNTEPKPYHGSKSRPPVEARQCGERHRQRYIRHLRSVATYGFGTQQFFAAHEAWKTARTAQATSRNALQWSTQQVRPEVSVIIGILQDRHVENTGKEISRAEVTNALLAAGLLPLLKDNSDFG